MPLDRRRRSRRRWATVREHVQAALAELVGLDAKFVLRDARLRIEESGIVTKLETLTLHALQASSLGRELSGKRPAPDETSPG